MQVNSFSTFMVGACVIVIGGSTAGVAMRYDGESAATYLQHNPYSVPTVSPGSIPNMKGLSLTSPALGADLAQPRKDTQLKNDAVRFLIPNMHGLSLTSPALGPDLAQLRKDAQLENDAVRSQHPALWAAEQYAAQHGDTTGKLVNMNDIIASNPYVSPLIKSNSITTGVVGWWVGGMFIEKGTSSLIPSAIAQGRIPWENNEKLLHNPFTAPTPTWTSWNAATIATWMAVHEGMYNPKTNRYYSATTAPAYSKYPGYQATLGFEQRFHNAWEFWLIQAEIHQHKITRREGKQKLKKFITTENYAL